MSDKITILLPEPAQGIIRFPIEDLRDPKKVSQLYMMIQFQTKSYKKPIRSKHHANNL